MNLVINIMLWVAYVISLYFSIFLLLVYLDKKSFFQKESSSLDPPHTPFISIFVPAYNEEKTILQTLESISKIDYPVENLEVLVIDDGSQDQTKEIIENFIADKPHFQLLSQKNQGKAAALNNALKKARGDFFACLDADSFVHPLTLRKMLAFYYQEKDSRLAIITPAMKVYQPKNLLQRIQWLEYLVMIFIGRLTSQLDSLYVAPGPFSLYKTEIIKKLGGFDEKTLTEDQEIAYRVQREQYKIKQCFDGYVYTTAPKKIERFYRQRRRWYLGSLSCLRQYKEMVANKKYGDFGLIQMVKNVAGYFLALTGIGLSIYLLFLPLLNKLKDFFLIRFNFWPYLQNFELNINWLSLFLADFRKGFIIIFLFGISFLFFYLAHKNAQEKIMKFGWIPLIPYFIFYYLLKGIILLLSLLEYSLGKKIKW